MAKPLILKACSTLILALFAVFLPPKAQSQSVIYKNFSEVSVVGEVDRRNSQKSYALIIFNAQYEQDSVLDLEVTENDAKAMEKLFIEMGYPRDNILVIGNKGKEDLENEVFDFAGGLEDDATVVVFYSGHGITFKGDAGNYIVPADVDPVVDGTAKRRERAIRRRVVNFEASVLDVLKDEKPAGIVVFYDACRDAPFSVSADQTKSLKSSSSFVPAKISGTAMFFSAKNGQQSIASLASDTADVNLSLFTRVLVSTLSENPSIRLRDLHPVLNSRVSQMAEKGTNGTRQQEPDYLPSLNYRNTKRQEFCLSAVTIDGEARCTGPEGVAPLRKQGGQVATVVAAVEPEKPTIPTTSQGAEAKEFELKYWDSVKDTKSPKVLNSYIKQYPDGKFVELARLKIQIIEQERNQKRETQSWQRAQTLGTIEAIDQYLTEFPNGAFSVQAIALKQDITTAGQKEQDDQDYRRAKTTGTIEALQAYKNKHRDGLHIAEAESLIAQIVAQSKNKELEVEADFWSTVKNSGNADIIALYTDKYPDGRFATEARDLMQNMALNKERNTKADKRWSEIKSMKSSFQLRRFITEFPDSPHVPEARKMLDALNGSQKETSAWQRAVSLNSLAGYQEYLLSHPNGPNSTTANLRIRELSNTQNETNAWRAAQNAHTVAAYEAYIRQYPNGQNRAAAFAALNVARREEACPTVNRTASRDSQAKQLVAYYYKTLDEQNVTCALGRWWSPSSKLPALVANFSDARVSNLNVVWSNSTDYHVTFRADVRARGGNWENYNMRAFVRFRNGVPRLDKLKIN